MFNNKLKKTAIDNYKKEYNKHESLVHEANNAVMNLYNERKSASIAIKRVETYINTLANSPKEFKKEIGDVTLSIKEFRDAVEFEKKAQLHIPADTRSAFPVISVQSPVSIQCCWQS